MSRPPSNFKAMKVNFSKTVQYLCAIILVVSSIVLAFIQVLDIDDVASGTLMYIAQAFLLAGSIFGLDYYVKKLTYDFRQKTSGATEQQPA